MKAKKAIKLQIWEYLVYLVIFLFFLVFFKPIRALFPPPLIGQEKIVGYAAYFGYPLYFDNFLFLYLIFCPVFAWVVFTLKKRIWKK